MSAADEKLIRWVRARMLDLTEEGVPQRFELYHVVNGQGSERIETIQLKEGDDPEAHAQTLWDAAEHDASTRVSSRGERYIIASFKESDEPEAQYPILMRRLSPVTELMGSDTEAPNETGIIQSQLRHTETLHRILAGSASTLFENLNQECRRMGERNQVLETQSLEIVRLYAESLDRKAERDLAQAEAQARARRNDQMMGMLMTLGPIIVAQIFGAKMPAAASSARDLGMQEFFERLEPEEMQGAIMALKPNNRMALIEMFKSYTQARSESQRNTPEIFRDGKQEKGEEGEEGEEEQRH